MHAILSRITRSADNRARRSRQKIARMWFRQFVAQLDDITDMLKALGRMLMEMDGKLERTIGILEEDA